MEKLKRFLEVPRSFRLRHSLLQWGSYVGWALVFGVGLWFLFLALARFSRVFLPIPFGVAVGVSVFFLFLMVGFDVFSFAWFRRGRRFSLGFFWVPVFLLVCEVAIGLLFRL